MIPYSDEQLMILAELTDEYFEIENNFTELITLLIRDNEGDSLKSILEMLGVYVHIISRSEAYELMKPFLEEMELHELYPYIDDPTAYKSIISRWRLSIGL